MTGGKGVSLGRQVAIGQFNERDRDAARPSAPPLDVQSVGAKGGADHKLPSVARRLRPKLDCFSATRDE